ncbi:toxin-antitoxin system YwqK family antitoxin [Candidatus Riflebacteria bacterium]
MLNKILFLIIFSVLFFSGCISCGGPPKDGNYKEYWPDGKIKIETNYKNGKKHGIEKWWWEENGNLGSFSNYKNGRKNGIHRYYHRTGVLYYEATYKDGKLHGIENWYEAGRLDKEVPYKDGEPHGIEKYYNTDNKVIKRIYWENGEKVKEEEVSVE